MILAAGRFFIAERERLQNGVAHGEPRQHRLRFVADPAGALPVDLMLADARTFAAIQGDSRRCDIGNGLSFAIPSPLHLIAMKLHALRSPERFENGVDLQDVKY